MPVFALAPDHRSAGVPTEPAARTSVCVDPRPSESERNCSMATISSVRMLW
jgi:hypothetical protein